MLTPSLKAYLLFLVVAASSSYFLFLFTHGKFAFPGDFFKVSGGKRIYIPFGGTLILSIAFFIVFTTKIVYYLIVALTGYFLYRLIFKKRIL